MPTVHLSHSVAVALTPRVKQLCGLFDVPPHERSERTWTCHLPLEQRDWNVGLIFGSSGCGKTTLARRLWPDQIDRTFTWPPDRSIVDAFPTAMSIKEVTGLLCSVGFSCPPSWLRPFRCLSNGEQFRVTLARTIAECPDLAVVDEFTSVVDRQVAQIGSAAIAKTIRRRGGKFVAVSCHSDIIEWPEPDWTYNPQADEFQWRCERQGSSPRWQRPPITLDIRRVHPDAWTYFRHHHYLTSKLSKAAQCFVGFVEGSPAVFSSVINYSHWSASCWREHRTVCLPDFQGVGLGNAMSAQIAAVFAATGRRYTSTTSHPAMIRHRAQSPLWHMHRKPSMVARPGKIGIPTSFGRNTASFTYVGPADHLAAQALLQANGHCVTWVEQCVLDHLHPRKTTTITRLAALTGASSASVRSALKRLTAIGLALRVDTSPQRFVASQSSPGPEWSEMSQGISVSRERQQRGSVIIPQGEGTGRRLR